MKRIITYEVREKPQWPKYRCPKCNACTIQEWHMIDNGVPSIDKTISIDPMPYHGEWQWICSWCGFETMSAHSRKYAKQNWKFTCENMKYKE